MTPPDLAAVKLYLGNGDVTAVAWDDVTVTEALAAESEAQASVCKTPTGAALWPADLVEALKRRVARNLAMRGLPLGLQTSMSEAAVATIRIGSDSEIRRLEGPYRRLRVG